MTDTRPGRAWWAVLGGVLPAAILAAILWPAVRESLAAVLTLVVAASTAAYALLTERLLEVQTRPNVIVSIELHGFMGYLIVENRGAGEAFDVRFEHLGAPETFPDELLSKARFLKDGFTYLAPSQKCGVALFNTTRPLPTNPKLLMTVRYRSRSRRRYVAEFPIDVGELMGLSLQFSEAERALLKLSEIEGQLKGILYGVQRPKT